MKIGVFIALVAAIASGCSHDPGAAGVVSQFYTTYAAIGSRGLPDSGEFATLAPYLTRRLQLQIDSARHIQNAYARRHPDDKPPFIEGDLFSSNFEGFSGFLVDSVVELGKDHYRVRVDLWYSDPVDPSVVVRWHDAVYVVREQSGYVIDDFEFLAPWPFGRKGRLSVLLRQAP
jgi:hypothetical protein